MMDTARARRILEVEAWATPAELRSAFRRRVLATHPDRHPGDPRATRRLMAVLEAYELLRLGSPRVAGRGEVERHAPPKPVPGRFHCPRCDDHFEVAGRCCRCDVPLRPRGRRGGVASAPIDAAVERMITRLEARPEACVALDPTRQAYRFAAVLACAGILIAGLGPSLPGLAIAAYGLGLAAMARARDAATSRFTAL